MDDKNIVMRCLSLNIAVEVIGTGKDNWTEVRIMARGNKVIRSEKIAGLSEARKVIRTLLTEYVDSQLRKQLKYLP